MLIKDWFNYFSTFMLSSGLKAKEVPEDGDLVQLCPCVSRASENETDNREENKRILELYSNNISIENLAKLPNSRNIELDQTIFTLFIRAGPTNGSRVYADDVDTLLIGGYDISKPTVVATHGFLSNDHTEWMIQLKTAQLFALDCNLITIDWSKCANNCCYFGARDCALAVGEYLRELLTSLTKLGANPADFHLMGHSLGAHLVSQASNDGLQVGRITGFDPPQWGFAMDDSQHRIDPDDATQVDIIHSSSTLGWNEILGKWDFFPNSAGRQPGCSIFNTVCGHSMSYFYYIQSLYHDKKYPATRCESLKKAINGNCHGETTYMGVLGIEGIPGVYYIKVEEPATGHP